jgi:TPR repeat protein
LVGGSIVLVTVLFFWGARNRGWLQKSDGSSNPSLQKSLAETAPIKSELPEILPAVDTLVVTQIDNPELAHVEAARNGDQDARLKLGLQYLNGDGLSKNDSAAFHWIKLAANQGLPEAQYRLALFYQDGIGISASRSKAAFWFEKAADKNHIRSQAHLGEVYLKGLGFYRDEGKGFRYLLKAAAAGDSLAQAILQRQGQKSQ